MFDLIASIHLIESTKPYWITSKAAELQRYCSVTFNLSLELRNALLCWGIIGLNYGLSPVWRQVVIYTYGDCSLIILQRVDFTMKIIETNKFSLKKKQCNLSSVILEEIISNNFMKVQTWQKL